MSYSEDELGKIETVLERLEKFRLPRLMDIKQRVDGGDVLNEFEIQYLEEALGDAEQNKSFVDHHPEFQEIYSRLVHLYDEITKKALEKKLVRGVVCEIELPEGVSLETGKLREEIGQLEGRAYKSSTPSGFDPYDPTDHRAKVEWVVHAPQGGTVKLTARHDRAGALVAEVELV